MLLGQVCIIKLSNLESKKAELLLLILEYF